MLCKITLELTKIALKNYLKNQPKKGPHSLFGVACCWQHVYDQVDMLDLHLSSWMFGEVAVFLVRDQVSCLQLGAGQTLGWQ